MATLTISLPTGTTVCNGKQITFRAPCSCDGITALVIEGITYNLCDSAGNSISSKAFAADNMVSIIMDTENNCAVLLSNVTRSTRVDLVLLVSNWSATGEYTISDSNITPTNVVELIPSTDITSDELEVLQSANIIGGTQDNGFIQLKAMGDVPNIDIPITLIIRGDI